MCVFSDNFCVNALEHVLNMYALAPVCVTYYVVQQSVFISKGPAANLAPE
jgi:hypothetical protein